MNKKLFYFQFIFCVVILLCSSVKETYASHAVGADLTYTCLGGNNYRFFFTLYRDCAGIPVNVSYTIAGTSPCGGSLSITVNKDSTNEIAHTCSTAVTRCASAASAIMGIEANYYHGDITLPYVCNHWTFGMSPAICNRNSAITNIPTASSYCLYVQATLNNAAVQCDNSPTFTNMPVAFLCAGQVQFFNHGAYDPDGDSLAFTMYTPHSDALNDVTYIAGLSATQPVTYTAPDSTRFNTATGDIRILANAAQITVIAVRADEYRNGVLIGSVERDIQIIVEACTDQPPTLTGINGGIGFIYTACSNAPFCFTVRSADLDAADNTTITWNGGIPGGTLTTTSTHRDTAHFCWSPTDADTLTNPHVFTATVTDNACPTFQSNIYTYIINVHGVIANAGPDQTVLCGGTANLHAIGLGAMGGPYTYTWLPGGTVGQDLLGVGVGNYQVVVSSQVSTNPNLSCTDTDEVVVNAGAGAPNVTFNSAMAAVCSRTFNFTDGSTVNGGGSILSWAWDFGDPASGANNTSTSQNPAHTFSGSGSYTVTLAANAGPGCDGQHTFQIVIAPLPVANFTGTSVCQGIASSFNSGLTSGNISNWNWNFNNGGGSTSTAQNPSYTFTAAGTYNVLLSVTDNNGCVDDTTITINIYANPTADAGLDASVCNGSSATLTATGAGPGGTYLWSSGQNTASITDSPVVTTVYTVTVTTVNGCQDTDNATINVNSMPVANAGVDAAICQGASTTLTATGAGAGGTYTWNPGNISGASITVSPGSTQIYTVTATSGPGCTSTDQVQVTVNAAPVANAGADQSVCDGSSATLTATGGTNFLWIGTGQTTASLVVAPAVTTTYQVQVSNAGGCPDTDAVLVTVNPIPVASFTNSGPVCEGGNITFTDQSNVSTGTINQWQWTLGGSAGTSTSQNPSSTYSAPGTPTVVLHITTNAGCTDSVTQAITVNANPVANAGSDGEICDGANTTLTASGAGAGGLYLWNPGGLTTASINISPVSTQNYTVTVTDANGCTNSDAVSVTVHPLPDAVAGPDLAVCKGNSATLVGAGGNTYLWTPGNITTASLTVTPAGTTTYYLLVTSAFGCTGNDTAVVTVNPLPVASFANNAPVCEGNSVSFIDNSNIISGTITAWSWNFGNAGTSTSQNPSSTYSAAGPFNVQLITTSDAGCKDTVTQNISIWAFPPADAGLDSAICDGGSASLTASGGVQYLWSPGGMTTATININPNVTTPYTVTVTDGNGCVAQDVASVIVNPLPVPDAGIDQSICFGDNTTLTATGGATYDWTPGNLSGASVSITPNITTTYSVLVTTAAGCQATDAVTVAVNPIPVSAFSNSGNVCQFNTISFTDQSNVSAGSITNWNWSFGNGSSSTDQSPDNFYSGHGNFSVTLTVTSDAGCTNQSIVDVIVYEKPIASITSVDVCDGNPVNFTNASSISDGSALTYAWNLGDASTSTDANPVHSYSGFGHYPINMIVTSVNGCSDTMDITANVNPLPNAAIVAATVCEKIPAELNDGSTVAEGLVVGWNWNFGDGGSSALQNVGHPYSTFGNYHITLDVVTDHGCPDHTAYDLRVKPNPIPDFTAVNDCIGKPTPFSDYSTIPTGSIVSWHWDFGDGTSEDNQNPVHFYPYSGYYDVTITETSDSGCTISYLRTQAVDVFAGPSAEFSSNAELADDNYPFVQFYNQTSTNGQFFWTFGDGDSSVSFAPHHLYDSVGIYQVQLITIDNKGCVDTTLKQIDIKPTSTFYVPNSFTPNKDGVNDSFRPYFTNLTDLDVMIYDRWGTKIYEYTNLDGGWDGSFKGNMAQSEVYVYKIKTKDIRDNVQNYVGHVTLIR